MIWSWNEVLIGTSKDIACS